MVDTLGEFILRELRERNCRSVHYWGSGNPILLRALVDAKFARISCSVSEGSNNELISQPAWMTSERRLSQGRRLDRRCPGNTAGYSQGS